MEEKKIDSGIKEFRKRMGYKTQTDLAVALGINQRNVSSWEIGIGHPSFELIKKLFELGITVEEMFQVDYKSDDRLVNSSEISEEEAFNIVKKGLQKMLKS